jgi:hypothetical protein
MMVKEPQISLLGTRALLFEAPGETSLTTQRRIWSLAREVDTWPEVSEAVPGAVACAARDTSALRLGRSDTNDPTGAHD